MSSASARDTQTVRYLGMYRFLSRAQIEEFVVGDTTLTPRSREVITWRILKRLRDLRLVTTNAVQAAEPEAMPTRIAYFLTAGGRRVFRALEPEAPRWRVGVEGTFLLAHALMVAEIALAFLRHTRAHPNAGGLSWECEWQLAESLAGLRVFPDARLLYETERRRIHAFIEADRGSEGSRFFGRKIERYLDLYRQDSWRARLPVWPLVLTVTRTARRASELCRATDAIFSGRAEATRISRAFRFTSLDALRGDAGPFAEIWQVAERTGRFPLIDEPAKSGDAAAEHREDAGT
jgi:hypothetical protein